MAEEYVRLPKLQGDTVIGAGDSPPNSTTPLTPQPSGTQLVAFGQGADSASVNRALGAVQENVDLLHADVVKEIAIPSIVNHLGDVVTDGSYAFIPMGTVGSPVRVYVYKGGDSDLSTIVSLLDENEEEVNDDSGEPIRVTDALTQLPSAGGVTVAGGNLKDIHAAADITALTKHTITCDATFAQSPGALLVRPACPGDYVLISDNHADNNSSVDLTWVVHAVRSMTQVEVRCVEDPSRALNTANPTSGTVTIKSNGRFYVNPVLKLSADPTDIEVPPSQLNVVHGVSAQTVPTPASAVAVAQHALAVDSLIKVKVRAAEEARGADPLNMRNGWELKDDFAAGQTSDGNIGELGWRLFGLSGAAASGSVQYVAPTTGEEHRLGILELDSGVAANQGTIISLASQSGVRPIAGFAEGIRARFSLKLEQTTSCKVWFGLVEDNDLYPGGEVFGGVFCYADLAGPPWYLMARDSEGNSFVGVGSADTSWHTYEIRGRGGYAYIYRDGNLISAATTNIPPATTSLVPVIGIITEVASSKKLRVDFFSLSRIGIER